MSKYVEYTFQIIIALVLISQTIVYFLLNDMEFHIQIYVLIQNIILITNIGIQILLRKYAYKIQQKFIRMYLSSSAIILALLMFALFLMIFLNMNIHYLIIHMIFSISIFGYGVLMSVFLCIYITLNEQLCMEEVAIV